MKKRIAKKIVKPIDFIEKYKDNWIICKYPWYENKCYYSVFQIIKAFNKLSKGFKIEW